MGMQHGRQYVHGVLHVKDNVESVRKVSQLLTFALSHTATLTVGWEGLHLCYAISLGQIKHRIVTRVCACSRKFDEHLEQLSASGNFFRFLKQIRPLVKRKI
ncbi:hypothetical protein RvY_03072-2 [Ramazzottius varieornatus]|uniref:Uncharacterized protein n=1 Tax=Ramazzottius varieornatus TaxID=947166 RepID=A0A1D1USJ2_RAMVA|nr:hypothetical protein RvY_03072-2 [Ramazzottius varieornatus]